ncbi:MAG TPA: hypothetical protein PKA05_22960, partial [Roseiflexaceae bacterium]|nr:hypothetical protein [Roseiflexaceae bacterium]
VFLAAAPGGSLILPFGPPSDNNYVPRPGDRYVVRDAQSGQDVAETTLGWPSVRWLPMLLR